MLQSQNFGGSHQTRLKTIIDGNQHAQQRYKRFSASNIALQQSIHLFAGSRILANFLNHLFLGIRQREREMLFVKCVEMFSHFSENKSIKLRLAVDSIAHNIQLDIKQLLEFETVFGIAQKNGIFGEMYIFYRIVIRHQMSRLQNIRRKRLGKTIVNHRKGISHDLVNRFRMKKMIFHLLRRVVHGHQTFGAIGFTQVRINFGMSDVPSIVEQGRFAKNNIFLIEFVFVFDIFQPLKPHQIDESGSIGEMGN